MPESNSRLSSSSSSLRPEGVGSAKPSNNVVGRLTRLLKRKSTSEGIPQAYIQQEVTQREAAPQDNVRSVNPPLEDIKREDVQQEAAQQDEQITRQLSNFARKDVSALQRALSLKENEKDVTKLRGQEARSMMELMQCLLDSEQLWVEFLYCAAVENIAISEKKWQRMGRLLVKLAVKLEETPKSLRVPAHYIWYRSMSEINASSAELYYGLYDKNQSQKDPRGKPIALKRLKHTEAQPRNDPKILRQLCEEALIWRQLKHPNVLPLIGVETTIFEDSDAPYCIVMPWMDNGTICNYMNRLADQQQPIPVGPWLSQIAHALDYLHRQRGVIHNDLRGANILIDHECSVRLTDFGVSFLMKTRTSSTELRYPKGGSTRWSAPERLNKEISRREILIGDHEGTLVSALDIYSFACTCVELFEGTHPMYDVDESADESTRSTKDHMSAVQYSICQGNHPCRPRGEGKEMSDELWKLLKRCWAKDAHERPVAKELVERLSTLIENGQLNSLSRPGSQERFAQSQITGSQ